MSRFGEDERATVLNPSKQRLVIAIVDDFMEMVSLNIVCVIHIHFWGTVSARIAALRVSAVRSGFDRMAWMVVARVESTAGCGVSARTGGFVVALAPWDGYSCWRMRSARGWCVLLFLVLVLSKCRLVPTSTARARVSSAKVRCLARRGWQVKRASA